MKPILKYLFIAEFADGSYLEQTQEDKPQWAMREDGSGSAFSDVLNPKSPLIRFTLAGDNREYGIDLRSLNFSVACGEYVSEFRLHSEDMKDAEILYFRNVRQHRDYNGNGKHLGDRTETSYRLGWKAKDFSGKEIEKFIEFD